AMERSMHDGTIRLAVDLRDGRAALLLHVRSLRGPTSGLLLAASGGASRPAGTRRTSGESKAGVAGVDRPSPSDQLRGRFSTTEPVARSDGAGDPVLRADS